jgi:hypothetical protein
LSDWFRAVPYLFGLGDTDSGKSQWAREIMARHCFRALYSEDLPGADIYEFLTNSGATIIEDEVQGLEKNPQKMKLYKGGYTAGSKVPRILINKNTGERRQAFYDSYGVKIFAGEDTIDNSGFMQRCLMMPMVKGRPKKDEFDPEDQPLVDEIRGRLLTLRILVAARKVKIVECNLDAPWFEGRFKQLYKALLCMTPEKERKLIADGAQRRYEERRAELMETLEAKTVIAYLEAVKAANGEFEVLSESIFERLQDMVTDLPEDRRPTLRSTGMRLTKLGFTGRTVRKDKLTLRMRKADDSTLVKVVRKYDLTDDLAQRGLDSLIPQPGQNSQNSRNTPPSPETGSFQAVSTASAEFENQKKAENEPGSNVSTVSTVSTTVVSSEQNSPSQQQLCKETARDRDHEAALEILRRKPEGYASSHEAVGVVMGLGFDRDLASLLVNHLTRDGLFGLYPDGRWRLTK